MQNFYAKLFSDPIVSVFFTKVKPVDLTTHLPIICDFWDTVLFQAGSYKRNALMTHKNLNSLKRLEKIHFERWLYLFNAELDKEFSGPNCNKMKEKAEQIAQIIQAKLK